MGLRASFVRRGADWLHVVAAVKRRDFVTFDFDAKSAKAALDYLRWKIPGIEPLRLGALLFLAEKNHLLQYGHVIVGGTILATEAGAFHKEACGGFIRLDSPWLPHASLSSWKRGIWS